MNEQFLNEPTISLPAIYANSMCVRAEQPEDRLMETKETERNFFLLLRWPPSTDFNLTEARPPSTLLVVYA